MASSAIQLGWVPPARAGSPDLTALAAAIPLQLLPSVVTATRPWTTGTP